MDLFGIVLIVLAVACAAAAGALVGRMMSAKDAGQEISHRILALVGLVAVAAAGIALVVVGR